MSRELRYGMVGGGPNAFIGDAHRRSIALDSSARLVAGCFSRSYEKTCETGRQLHIEEDRLYHTYEEMARKESEREDGIDFVCIVTPNNAHYEACKAFLEAGIHVSCDKPLTTTLEEARELEALAREKGLLFMVTYGYSGHVACKHIRQMIERGDIGEIRMIAGEYIQGWLAGDDITGNKQGEWRTDPKQSGRSNCLGDIGTHIENTVARMTGLKIKKVLANMEIKVPTRVLDDNDMVMVQYDNGASGMYWSSQIAIGCDNGLRVRICGSKGSIFWFQEEPEKIKIANLNGTVTEIHRGHDCIYEEAARYARLPSGHPEGWFEAMGNLYRSFTECIIAKEENRFTEDMIDYPTVADGVEGLAFVEACLASSDGGNVWTEMEA